jgi:hypothetical protein
MNSAEKIERFIAYYKRLPENVTLVIKRQLESSIVEYLNSLTPDETYRAMADLNGGVVPDTLPALPSHRVHVSERVPDEIVDRLESHIYTNAIMDLYKLGHELTLAITSERINVNSISKMVDQAVATAAEDSNPVLNANLNSFIASICTPIYDKFAADIVVDVNKEVAARVNSLFK